MIIQVSTRVENVFCCIYLFLVLYECSVQSKIGANLWKARINKSPTVANIWRANGWRAQSRTQDDVSWHVIPCKMYTEKKSVNRIFKKNYNTN